jgi:anaerobic selenocysteine-containing dehydrogenase
VEADGPPLVMRHTCGEQVAARMVCSACGEPIEFGAVRSKAGLASADGRPKPKSQPVRHATLRHSVAMSDSERHPSACILCECNCGIEIRSGPTGTFERIRGDKAHPALAGVHLRKGTAPEPLPERRRSVARTVAQATRRIVRGDRLGDGDS